MALFCYVLHTFHLLCVLRFTVELIVHVINLYDLKIKIIKSVTT
jgi:hypothetical protein